MPEELSKVTAKAERHEEQKQGVSGQRELTGAWRWVVGLLSATLTILVYYTAFWGTYPPIIQRGGYLLFALPLTFMLYRATKDSAKTTLPWFDRALAAASAAPFLWAILNHDRIIHRMYGSDPVDFPDIVMGVVAVLVIMEATRRTMGMVLNYIALFFFAYALFGSYMPGLFTHKGVAFDLIIEHSYLVPEGIFNMIMGVQATFLFTFLSFSSVLVISGADRIFLDLATAIGGRAVGGPAKISVISSMLFGSISGSTVANVVVDGVITIPLMKKCGFKPHEAAAIETAASTGGAIMPPVMGAGIFLMAEFTSVPLATIIKVSFLPALLYYGSIFFYVHIKAKKHGLTGIPGAVIQPLGKTILRGAHLFFPIFVLVYMIYLGFTPFLASAACTALILPVGALRAETRMTWRKILWALELSTRVSLIISAISASGAMIMGLMTITGLIEKMQSVILSFSGGSLLVGIILVALMAYVLGMPLPVTTTYIILAMLSAPALVALMKASPIVADKGLSPEMLLLTAHLVIFWFAQDATITPPVCMTAFAAAAIAESDYMRTGWESMWVAKALYIMPFLLAYSGILLWHKPLEMIFDFVCALIAFALLPAVMEGYLVRHMRMVERGILLLAVVVLFISTFSFGLWGFLGTVLGLAIAGGAILYQKITPEADPAPA